MAIHNHDLRNGIPFSSVSCASWAQLTGLLFFAGVACFASLAAAEPVPVWPVIPSKGAMTWREIAGQKNLPAFDVAASAALVSGWNGEGIVVFPTGQEVTLDYSPGVTAEFDLQIGHLEGPGYGAFTVELDGKKLGRVQNDAGRVRPAVTVMRTPLIRAMAHRLRFRPKTGCRIALFCITEKVLSFQPLPVSAWTVSLLPNAWTDGKAVPAEFANRGDLALPAAVDSKPLTWQAASETAGTVDLTKLGASGTVCAVTYLHSPAAFTSLCYRLKTAAPALLGGDGQPFLTLTAGAGQGEILIPYHKLRPGLSRLVLFLPAGKDARFTLETTPLGGARFLPAVPPALDPLRNVADWPRATISNGLITAELPLPDPEKGYYRSTRFEAAGQITNLTFAGHRFFAEFAAPPRNPTANEAAAGTAEEFFEPIGYDEAKVGESFIKIGVGRLEKPWEHDYFFGAAYWMVDRFPWESRVEGNTAEFAQRVTDPRGWGYDYRKRAVLTPGKAELVFEHEFCNTGRRRIVTNQYNHSFILIDGDPAGPGYRVEFNFPVVTVNNVEERTTRKGNAFQLKGGTVFSPLRGFLNGAAAEASVIHEPSGARVTVSGDFAPFRYWLFSSERAVCPESFVHIDLAPGESMTWKRVWKFEVKGK